jgi:Retrotransposon gag protein
MATPAGPAGQPQGTTQVLGMSQDQFTAILESIQDMSRPTRNGPQFKAEKPPTFDGEKTKLRTFLAQCDLYFTLHQISDNNTKINYMKTLFRGSAAKWITPYIEGAKQAEWEDHEGFKAALKTQFGDPDAEGTARNQLEQIRQNKDTASQYWNNFRLLTTDANMDDGTLQRLFLRGLNTRLQTAWTHGAVTSNLVDDLAAWSITQENRYTTMDQIQTPTKTQSIQSAPRNTNGTFQQKPTIDRGDPMELDAFRRNRRLNISPNEYRRRRAQGLCLKCAKPGHMVKDCKGAPNEREGITQYPRFSPRRARENNERSGNWRQGAKIKEIELEEEEVQEQPAGNEECPQ